MSKQNLHIKFPHLVKDILSPLGIIDGDELVEQQLIKLLCLLMFLVGIAVFIILLFIPAVYGRYAGSNSLFGFGVNSKLAWFLQESPSFLVPTSLCMLDYANEQNMSFIQIILSGLFILHYWQRTFIYSSLIQGGKPTPIGICALAFTFCTVNGYIQVRSIQLTHFASKWLLQPSVAFGIVLFFIGLAINIHSDHVLRNLRKPGETGYKIPRGGLYNYVTAANYFGETLEWFGFFLAVQTLASAAFSFFTVANLLPRGIAHDRWYKSKFEDYPKDRKVFFPFLF